MPRMPGVVKGLGVTLGTMARTITHGANTVQYPREKEAPPIRARGVIALREENCTVCMLCARSCPDWCIYIEGHKEKAPPRRPGGKPRTVSALDRFDIDYALCMYCGICVEVCPFDALFWSPEYEYSEPSIAELLHDKSKLGEVHLKATCAPHYYRIRAQRLEDERARGDFSGTFIAPGTRAKAASQMFGEAGKPGEAGTAGAIGHPGGHQALSAMTRGCLAGTSVCFISNEGAVYPCGYLPVSAGDTRVQRFAEIWNNSTVFRQLRNPEEYEGKCGDCRYVSICGGCRARAYAATGCFLAEEPFCTYRPDLDRPQPKVVSLQEVRHDAPLH